jgi:(1->4)-alpha-D-glucan 1-alpha-D-glucosylmutase
VLSQRAGEWLERSARWRKRNADKKRQGAPDVDLELLFYQVLVGAWPLSEERALAYLEKAAREAKTRTSWTRPDEAYEAAMKAFVAACYADADFLADVEAFVGAIAEAGRVVALAQVVLKLTVPGVPDLYQGAELELLDLVDPDNRRPVDYARRQQLLAEVTGLSAGEAWRRAGEGVAKLFVTQRLLDLRRRRAELFASAGYQPVELPGVLAFRRDDELVVAVPLRPGQPLGDERIALPAGPFVDVLTGARHRESAPLAQIFRDFPVAVLERAAEEHER